MGRVEPGVFFLGWEVRGYGENTELSPGGCRSSGAQVLSLLGVVSSVLEPSSFLFFCGVDCSVVTLQAAVF